MSSEDVQIDVLLRRHAGRARQESAVEHLDPDEMAAFAEGSLPDAARSRYVSHLADCDDCRRVVSQLAIASGAVIRAEPAAALTPSTGTWREKLATIFRPPTLRYAAFGVVLVAAIGITLIVINRPKRSQNQASLVAKNEPASQSPVSSLKTREESVPSPQVYGDAPIADRSKAQTAPTPGTVVTEPEAAKAGELAPPPKPMKEATEPTTLADKNAAQPTTAEAKKPAYSPPPPQETERERAELQARNQQGLSNNLPSPSSQQTQNERFGVASGRNREDVRANNRQMNETVPATGTAQSSDEKAKVSKRDSDSAGPARKVKEAPKDVAKTESGGSGSKMGADDAGETRSVGGRKFHRQGNSWVDSKYKSSMTLKNISRSSEEFSSLDSGLRAIGQQLGGDVIVVWKGKAYLIR